MVGQVKKNEETAESVDINNILRLDEDDLVGSQESKGGVDEVEEIEDFPIVITKQTIATSPWSRIAVIAVPFGIGFLAIFLFLNGIFNPAKKMEIITQTAKPSTALDKVEHKDGDIYTKLALSRQSDELDKINKNKKADPKNIALSNRCFVPCIGFLF